MTGNKTLQQYLLQSFLFLSLVYWIQFAILMMRIANIQTISQATTLMNTSNIFVIRVLYHVMNNTQGMLEFFLSISQDLSLSFIVFVLLLFLMNFEGKKKRVIWTLLILRFVVSSAFLICLFFALTKGTVPKGIAWANQTGIIFMILSLVLVLLSLILLVLSYILAEKS